jgi:hypothetical protein
MKGKGPTPPARCPAQPAVVSWPEPAATNYDLPVMQLRGERERLVVTGRRSDDGNRCELLVVADVGGSYAFYPHGGTQFGVQLAREDTVIVARLILGPAE